MVSRWEQALRAAGCPDADYDARELYRFVTGRDPRFDDGPTPDESARLDALTARRAAREPLQYILGEWEFMGIPLKVGPGVLCPRPDSEVVCETAVALLEPISAPVVLDLCAGTGCLGLGIRRFVPSAQITCVEKSPQAFAYLQQNLRGSGVCGVMADAFTFADTLEPASLDLLISNPPYLTEQEMGRLMPETAREPAMALDGGADGLDFYRLILREYRKAVRPGGWLVLEIGCAQAAVLALGAAEGWRDGACRQDYGGNDRVIVFRR